MKKKFVVGLLVGAIVACFGTVAFAAVDAVPLQNSDCVKCHLAAVQDVDAQGARHKSDVGCLDCHLEHPPEGTKVIPQCSMCHDPADKDHFKVANCINCHYPHYPLKMEFAKLGVVKPVCLTCHPTQGTELTTYPSKHTELDCQECHLVHAEWQECLACHQGHTADMTYQDCLRCHQPHMPTVVKYDAQIPNGFCGGCHATETDVLAKNQTKHHDLACVYCHKDQHKMVPQCETCHGIPHGNDMHQKYPNCLDCHMDPHALTK